METTFLPAKTTIRVRARPFGQGPLASATGVAADAYEIHAGITRALAGATPLFSIVARGGTAADDCDGTRAGAVAGTYLHGVFAAGPLRRALLTWLAERAGRKPRADWGAAAPRLARWDRLADIVAAAVDLKAVGALVGRSLR